MKVIVVGGSSGGHIFPAIGFLDGLKSKDKDLKAVLVLPQKHINLRLEGLGYPVRTICIPALTLKPVKQAAFFFLGFFLGIFQSFWLLLRYNPDIVVAFGSISSIPLVNLAWLFRTETVIHEQNASPGRANRLLANFASRIAISYPQSRNYFKGKEKKLMLTGNPLRKEISKIDKLKARDFFGLDRDRFTLLVMGGSQGSQNINRVVREVLAEFSKKKLLQIIHLSGEHDFEDLQNFYSNSGYLFRLSAFLEDVSFAYSAADLVISRAGAISISEVVFFELPAIIIPYPHAGGHQVYNALALQEAGCALIIEDRHLEAAYLSKELESIFATPSRLESMRLGYANLYLSANSASRLADEVLSLTEYDG